MQSDLEEACMAKMEKLCDAASSVKTIDLSSENQKHVRELLKICHSMDFHLDSKQSAEKKGSSSSSFLPEERFDC
tara:strand:+ start:186 stop:410 length:225 start_codon:yes stop_codon:yes gene_type:complete